MKPLISIQPDGYGQHDCSHEIWVRVLERAGFATQPVDVYRPDILERIAGSAGFMWRWAHFGGMERVARRLLPVIETQLGIPVYPDQKSCWHYDDKIAQFYLLSTCRVPMPKTWIFYRQHEAIQKAEQLDYPVVLKLYAGAAAENVILLQSFAEAEFWIGLLFGRGVSDLAAEHYRRWPIAKRLKAALKALVKGEAPWEPLPKSAVHRGYVYLQEYLAGNAFDTRVTIIGNRAYAFRRYNRANDFRASGSGLIDWTPESIDERFIRLAFFTARQLGSQSCAIDGLMRDRQPVVGEVSYTYRSWGIQRCPGHWVLQGDIETGRLDWKPGSMWPEEAQAADFIERVRMLQGGLGGD
ncbi:MAG: hypothetical protein JXM75_00260 [Chromatiaceae bacterium]|nr:hypothetical protein [Chromatiaceae bacterium]